MSDCNIEFDDTIHSLELQLLDVTTCLDREIEEHERDRRILERKMVAVSIKIDEITRMMRLRAEWTD